MTRSSAIILTALVFAATMALAEPPQEAVQHYEKGLALKRSGRPAKAAVELRAAIKLDRKYTQAHYALAWVYRQLGKDEEAIEQFREVIRQAPHSPEAVESARAIERIRLGPEARATGGPERIAFASTRGQNTDIYAMDVTGSGLVRLTSHPAADDSPSWSPDGQRLAFVSERDGNREIYTVKINGSELQRVTDNAAADDHPVWSPDGKWIAFESNREGKVNVYVIAADGSTIRRLTYSASDDWMGDWSPDGSRIATLSNRDGVNKVYVMNADGTYPERLVENSVPEGRPVWDPTGPYIYFTWNFERNQQVCRVGLDGRELANVTRSPYNERLCDISRDGRRMLVASNRQNDEEIYLIEIDTGAARRLTFNPGPDGQAVFTGLSPERP